VLRIPGELVILLREIRQLETAGMTVATQDGPSGKVVTLRLNKQQLELFDRTISRGVAKDRVALVKLALREYAAKHKASSREKSAP
jgi:hypothetical protein